MEFELEYGSEAEIPAEVKQFYKQVGAKWVFQSGMFKGLAEALNPGLAKNRDDLRTEKETAEQKAKDEKARADAAETELSKLKKPGTVIITEKEKQSLEEYEKLGTPADIAKKIEEGTEAAGKLTKYETEKSIRQLAKDTGVDEEALVDFKLNSSRGENVTLGKQKKKVKVGNKEVEKEILTIIQVDKVNDKDVERHIEFSAYAKDNHFPKYLVDGIYTAGVEEAPKTRTVKKEFYVPPTTVEKVDDDKSAPVSTAKERVKKLNSAGTVRKMPWETA